MPRPCVHSAEITVWTVVVEVGARYAPWAVRAMAAARLLGRQRYHAVLMEPVPLHIRWLKEHFQLNGFGACHTPSSGRARVRVCSRDLRHARSNASAHCTAPSDYTVRHAKFGRPHESQATKNHSTPWMGLAQLLEGLEHVDYLDMDAQDGERFLVQSTADSDALRRVRRVHIETHSDETGAVVLQVLRAHGFRVLRNATDSVYEIYRTAVGPVLYRGGSIYAVNRRASSTLNGGC